MVPAPVRVVKARNMGGLGEGSRALILQMMHQLRLQDEEDERQRQQEEAQGGSAAGGASGPEKVSAHSMLADANMTIHPVSSQCSCLCDLPTDIQQVKCAAASVPKTSRMSAQHIAALEASLLASGDEEEEDEAGDGSSSSSSDDKEEGGNDGQLDGTFRRVANFLAKGNSGSSSGSGEEAEADEEENDEGSSSSSSEEGDEGAAAVQPQPTKKLSQRDQEMLLKTLIKDERKAYVAEQQAAQEAAMEAAVARKARAGKINIKVRVTLTAEKGGAKRLVVLERKKTLDGLLAVAKSKLKIKKPLRAYLADSRAAVENTLLLADDAVVVVTDRAKEAEEEGGEERGRRTGKPKREDKEKEGKPQAVPVDHEAELDVVKEAFKLRTEDRYDNGGPKGGAGVEQESARLKAALEERQASATFDDVRAQREGLPASRLREEIVRAVDRAQVVVVEGETGSGKTTQVV